MKLARLLAPLLVCVGCSSCGGAPTQPSSPTIAAETTPATAETEAETETPPAEATAADDATGFAEPPPLANVPAPSRAESEGFASAANALGFDVYGKIRRNAGNLVFSPASLEIAFAMTAAGARTATADEMNRVLHVGADPAAFHASAGRILTSLNQPRDAYELHVVNRLFGEQSYRFEQPFLDLTRDTYRAPFEPMDFLTAAEPGRQRINAWVMDQTNDRIDELLPPDSLNTLTRLVLVNAVYFLGKWQKPFDPHSTEPGFFFVNGSDRQTTPTMHQTSLLQHGEVDGVQVLEMAYQGDDLAMTFLLPRARNGLGALEASLDQAKLTRFVGALRPTQVSVSLPKFEIRDARFPVPDVMKDLGMRLAFDRDRADFTGMGNPPNPQESLYVSDAFHEAFIRVDEEGTEAAAATGVVMGTRSLPPPPKVFRADRPFFLLIRDNGTGAVLFMGRVSNPA